MLARLQESSAAFVADALAVLPLGSNRLTAAAAQATLSAARLQDFKQQLHTLQEVRACMRFALA